MKLETKFDAIRSAVLENGKSIFFKKEFYQLLPKQKEKLKISFSPTLALYINYFSAQDAYRFVWYYKCSTTVKDGNSKSRKFFSIPMVCATKYDFEKVLSLNEKFNAQHKKNYGCIKFMDIPFCTASQMQKGKAIAEIRLIGGLSKDSSITQEELDNFCLDPNQDLKDFAIGGNLILEFKRHSNPEYYVGTYIFIYNRFRNHTKKHVRVYLGDARELSLKSAKVISAYFAHKIRHQEIDSFTAQDVDDYKKNYLYPALPSEAVKSKNPPFKLRKITQDDIDRVFLSFEVYSFFDNCEIAKPNEFTFEKTVEQWFRFYSHRKPQANLEKERRQIIKYFKCFFPYAVQDLALNNVLQNALFAIYELSPSVAMKLLVYLRQVFSIAFLKGDVTMNPLSSDLYKVFSYNAKEHRKTLDPYYLEQEIKNVFSKLMCDCDFDIRACIELLFFTLLRPNELLTLKWENVSFEHNSFGFPWIEVPKTKNILNFKIPLNDHVMNIFKLLKKGNESQFVFNSPRLRNQSLCLTTVNTTLRKFTPYLHAHGIRSVGANWFAQNIDKIPYEIGLAFLGHIYSTKTHMAYEKNDFLYLSRAKHFHLWSEFITEAIGPYSVLNRI